MVGFIDPNPPKPPQRPPPPQEKWWKSMFTNPIQIKRPVQGKYSPKVDERCFTWCSQTVRGRTEGQDPWCRSICIRRVFEHEVRQLTSHFSHDSAHHSQFSSSSSSSGTGTNATDKNVKNPELKYPLPPEGQRKLFDLGLDDDDDDDDEYSSSRYPSSSITTSTTNKGKEKQDDEVKYWQEGWYIWMTKNRWAVQEKMDLMMLDLERQAHWQKMKEQEERAWAESQAQALDKGGEGGEPGTNVNNGNGDNVGGEPHLVPIPLRQPFPNAVEESFLLRVPTHLSLIPYLSQTFQPTTKVLSIFKQSLDNGDQRELWMRGWDAAREGVPFRLVKNVVRTCMDSLKKGPKDEE